MSDTSSTALQSGIERHRAGDLEHAERMYRDVLRIDPRHADALHLLGVVAMQRRQHVTAMDYIGQAIDSDRQSAAFHNSLGNVYRALGRTAQAIDEFRTAIRLKPDCSEAYNDLGILLAECDETAGALACFEQATKLDPGNLQAWSNLGSSRFDVGSFDESARAWEAAIDLEPENAALWLQLADCHIATAHYGDATAALECAAELGGATGDRWKRLAEELLRRGELAEAEAAFRGAIADDSGDASCHLNLAQILKERGQLDEAIICYRRGLALDPTHAKGHYALGRALHAQDGFAEAAACYERAIALGSCDPQAAHHLGNSRKSLRNLRGAIEAYQRALQWDAEFTPALHQLGNAYRQLNELAAAQDCLERVLERNANDLDAIVSLGNVLKEQDNLAGAAAQFRKVTRLLPHEPLWKLWVSTLCPVVFHSRAAIDHYRQSLAAELNRIGRQQRSITAESIASRGCPPPYALQFHGMDDRPLREAYARIFRDCAPSSPIDARPVDADRPRIGFVVTDGHEGVFLRYLKTVVEKLDRERFQPIIICSAGGERRLRLDLPEDVIETFVIPSRFDEIVPRIAAGRFDVLYHWEVGSDVTNYFLPHFKLAPVQCTGAGLPETTGIAAVDWFLSNDVCEPAGAQAHYTERLYRAQTLLTAHARPAAPAGIGRGFFGVDPQQHFYVCPHKIEKFHPDLDSLFAEILRRDRQAVIVIPKDREGTVAGKLQNRLRLTLRDVADRVRFIPFQPTAQYFGLLRSADVLLDPIYYGGGLTSYDGLGLGKPIVTLPGDFVRGRYTMGFLRTLGVEECIAGSREEYVDIAVRLACERDWREHIAERIARRSYQLFDDPRVTTEYETIFDRLARQSRERR